MGSILTIGDEIFNIFISLPWWQDKVCRLVPPLNKQCFKNTAESRGNGVPSASSASKVQGTSESLIIFCNYFHAIPIRYLRKKVIYCKYLSILNTSSEKTKYKLFLQSDPLLCNYEYIHILKVPSSNNTNFASIFLDKNKSKNRYRHT